MPVHLTQEPLLDLYQIASLRTALGDDDLQAMLSDFATAARRAFVTIEAALQVDDLTEARRAAHAFKGVASSFGAARLTAIAVDMELGTDSLSKFRERLPAFADAIVQTSAAMRDGGFLSPADDMS